MAAPTAVVMPDYAGPVGFALQGLTGAATGLTQAAQARTEQARWDKDMELRYQTLAEEKRNNRLTLEQRDRFAVMEDLRARELQTQGENFQQHLLQDVTQPWEGAQNDENRKVQMHGIERDYQSSTWATQKAWEANMSQVAEQQRQFSETDGYKMDLVSRAMGGRTYQEIATDANTFETVVNQITDGILGAQRTSNAPGVAQAPAAEREAAHQEALDWLQNAPTKEEAYFGKAQKLAVAMSVAKANGPMAYATGHDLVLADPSSVPGWAENFPGKKPRDISSIPSHDLRMDTNIMNLITDAVIQSEGLDSFARKADIEPYVMSEIMKQTSAMYVGGPRIEAFYKDLLLSRMYPDPTDPAAAASADVTLVGGAD